MTLLVLPAILEGEDKSSPLANRLRNTYRHLRKWAKRTQTDCFRLYDRAIPRYPLAIDFYAGRFCVQYFSRSCDQSEPSLEFIQEIENALYRLFGTPKEAIYWRSRARSKETRQHEKRGEAGEFFTVMEYGVKFRINLTDYLDTGLFLDHRETRQLVAGTAKGKRLLNLFAYTCSFSVHAAIAGAVFTKSVDLSNTYTAWGRGNFQENGLPLHNHPIVRADCLKFLQEEFWTGAKYDLIVIDPPTISRSKKMDQLFDIQVDYVPLLFAALKLLVAGGVIFFSTNSRKFVLDSAQFPQCSIIEISHQTVPIDFQDCSPHRCWKLSRL
jgi:23S rRNA (cytosine1962-C5)-methyltransferase